MARKNMRRILSDAGIVFCVILLCTLNISSQGFEIKKLTFVISGSVGMSGVKMNGLPNSPISDNNGFYSDIVDYGWSGTVTPVIEGFTFDPPFKTYNNVKGNFDNQNYNAAIKKFTISGLVGQEGVVMIGLPDSPKSGSDGTYKCTLDYGWSGTVIPTKEGMIFNPTSKQYNQINKDYANENYTSAPITFEISGTVGQPGVTMKGLPDNPVSGADGTYKANVKYGWNGTVTPEKEGFNFNPVSRPYSNVISGQTYQDYIAEEIVFTISGTVGVPGIVMKGLPNDPVTGADGSYVVPVKYGFIGKVAPEKPGFTFKPPFMTYSKVTSDYTNQNYTSEEITFTISGSVGQEGVVMNGLPGSLLSGPGGAYKATVQYGWNGTVIPIKEGYTFNPEQKIYPNVIADQLNQNYTAAAITFTISGSAGVSGVLMKGLPGRIVTNEKGFYNATVDFSFSGMVIPEKTGYTFTPPTRSYTRVIAAETGQDYTQELEKRVVSGKINTAKGPVGGITLFADNGGGTVTTNVNGEYSLSVVYNWSGTLTPSSEGYTFKPAGKKYAPITQDRLNEDFAAEVVMLTITGVLPMPIEGVLMSASEGGESSVTDAKGRYAVKVPYGWTGEISPKKEGFEFDPPSESYTNVTTNYVDHKPVLKEQPERKTPPPTASSAGPVASTFAQGQGPSVPGPTVSEPGRIPPKFETKGPTVEVPAVSGAQAALEPEFDEQSKLLENQIETLQDRVNGLLRQLSGEEVPSAVPTGAGEPNVTTAATPRIPGAVKPEAPAAISPIAPPRTQRVPGGPLVSISCIDTDLREVLKYLSAQSGVDIHADDTVKGKVTCQLRNVPLEKALEEILKRSGGGYAFKEVPNSYLIYKPISNAFFETELRQALQDIGTTAGVVIVPDDTVSGRVSATLDAVPLDTALEIVLAGTNFMVKKTPNYYLVASGRIEDPAFPTVSETHRVKMNYIQADLAIGLLSTVFRPYVQAETTTHTVLVTAQPALAKRIVSDLKQIDIPPRHVMLEARIVVMERSNLLNLGIEWGWPKVSAGVFGSDLKGGGDPTMQFGGNWPWGVQIGYTPDAVFTNSLLLTLNLLNQNGEADIVSSPQVLAQDGKQSQIKVMNEEYYYLTAQQTAAYYTAEAQLETITAGTTLTITPRIGDGNDITLDIAAEVSDVVSRGVQTDQTVPLVTVSRRNATNTVRIRDGGTVAVAGLTENKSVKENSRVPGLGSLPILGGLFKNTRNQQSKREIAVFITARLVPDMEELIRYAEPAAETVPAEPMREDDFRASLLESLSRPTR